MSYRLDMEHTHEIAVKAKASRSDYIGALANNTHANKNELNQTGEKGVCVARERCEWAARRQPLGECVE